MEIITGDRTAADVMSGDYIAQVFSKLNETTIDLSARFIALSASQTNFITAVRAQIPYGKALFVLDSRQPNAATNRIAFWVEPNEIDAKGNRVQRPKAPSR